MSRREGRDGVTWIDGFLSPRACEAILGELDHCFWWPSTVVSQQLSGEYRSHRSPKRVSQTTTATWFSSPLRREIRALDRRIARMFGDDPDSFEGWQATRYARGERFDDHYDIGHCRDEPQGERKATLVLYLHAPHAGGATRFRDLDLEVAAKAGRLLYFRNLLPDGSEDLRMLHSSLPVRRGRKVTLVNWVRERAARTSRETTP